MKRLTKQTRACPGCEDRRDWYPVEGASLYRCHACGYTLPEPAEPKPQSKAQPDTKRDSKPLT